MGKLPRCVIKRINHTLKNRTLEIPKTWQSKITVVKEEQKQEEVKILNVTKFDLGKYSLYHFPNLNLWVKARPDLINELEGYQPDYNALRPVDEEFVSKVLSAKIQGILNL